MELADNDSRVRLGVRGELSRWLDDCDDGDTSGEEDTVRCERVEGLVGARLLEDFLLLGLVAIMDRLRLSPVVVGMAAESLNGCEAGCVSHVMYDSERVSCNTSLTLNKCAVAM